MVDQIPQVKPQFLSLLSKLLETLLFHVHGEGSSIKSEVLLPLPECRMKTEWNISNLHDKRYQHLSFELMNIGNAIMIA